MRLNFGSILISRREHEDKVLFIECLDCLGSGGSGTALA